MAILCVEGNVSPGDFLDVLDYDDSLLLAKSAQKIVTDKHNGEADQRSREVDAVLKAIGSLQKSIGVLNQNLARGLGGR